jgi:hypothetical protein
LNPHELEELKDQLTEIQNMIRSKQIDLDDLRLEEDELMNMIELAEERVGLNRKKQ